MSFTTWFFDYDNDGWPDIFVSGYSATMPNIVREMLGDKANAVGARPRLYRNNRDGTFTDVSRSVRPRPAAPHDGRQLRRPRQRRLARLLPRHRCGAADHNIVPNQMFRNDARAAASRT